MHYSCFYCVYLFIMIHAHGLPCSWFALLMILLSMYAPYCLLFFAMIHAIGRCFLLPLFILNHVIFVLTNPTHMYCLFLCSMAILYLIMPYDAQWSNPGSSFLPPFTAMVYMLNDPIHAPCSCPLYCHSLYYLIIIPCMMSYFLFIPSWTDIITSKLALAAICICMYTYMYMHIC